MKRTHYDSTVEIFAVAIIYFLSARIGLELQAVSGFATFIWAPTGIAIAAMLLIGRHVWPAIFLSAAFVNFTVGAPPLTALVIGAGNTLEAVAAFYLLKRVGFDISLNKIRDVFWFILLAGGISTLVSSIVGVAGLWASGMAVDVYLTWQTWWIGDMMGALVVAPFILVWSRMPKIKPDLRFFAEVGVFLLFTATVCALIFSGLGETQRPLAFVLFLPLIIGAVKFGHRGATAAVLIVSMISIAGTIIGTGPFAKGSAYESLLLLQTFMGFIVVDTMIITAAFAQREKKRRR